MHTNLYKLNSDYHLVTIQLNVVRVSMTFKVNQILEIILIFTWNRVVDDIRYVFIHSVSQMLI